MAKPGFVAVWHSELMEAKNRGKGLAIELAINIFGVMLSYWVDYGMSYVKNDSQFRFPLALQILFAIITVIGLAALPESPSSSRWYGLSRSRPGGSSPTTTTRRPVMSSGRSSRTPSRSARTIRA